MKDFIFYTVFWVLAIYGLIEIVKEIVRICTYTNLKSNGIYIVVAVKNEEKRIEGFLRSFLFKIIYGKEENIKKIIVCDLDSIDDTKNILKRLNREYSEIKISNWNECKDIIENIKDV